jgi:flagellar assembly protein FliH
VIIPKEDLPAFQKWQAGSFDKKKAPAATSAHKPEPQPVSMGQAPVATEELPGLPTAEDVERIYEEARAAGYAAGLAEGQASGEEQAREAVLDAGRQFRALIDNLNHALDSLDQSVAEELLALAIEIASQVMRGAISAKSDALLPVVREAISSLPMQQSNVVLRLNPGDAASIRALLGDEFAQTGTQIVEDSEISIGGCRLLAGASEVDATIETRWKRVLESIGAEPREWLNP